MISENLNVASRTALPPLATVDVRSSCGLMRMYRIPWYTGGVRSALLSVPVWLRRSTVVGAA